MEYYIAKVEYRVIVADDNITHKTAEEIEAQRWQMFQKRFGVEPLSLKVEVKNKP